MSNPFGGATGQEAIDAVWVILCGFIIFTMQTGFGLLESGLVSTKSETNVMVKNMFDVILGGIAYWFVGYGFSYGANDNDSSGFSGNSDFMTDGGLDHGFKYAKFFFQLSFAATATTIVSGAVAERIKLKSYMIFAFINTGLIYVFPAHWMWNANGWLAKEGALDFAGSSVVHMSGGAAALCATLLLGPRVGKFKDRKYNMASPTNAVLGTFFLWWGWIGFNCGSTFAMSGGSWKVAARVSVVTMNGGMAGGASALVLNLIFDITGYRSYFLDISELVSGVLGGLVAITASANVTRPWEALIIGFIGGLIAIGVNHLLDKLKVDDPVGCVGVHYCAGFWAMVATGLFAEDFGNKDSTGIFHGGNGKLLGWNLAACLAISLWSGGLSVIVFLSLKYTIGFRLEEDEELRGSDEVEHNIIDEIRCRENSKAFGKQVSKYGSNAIETNGLNNDNFNLE